MAPSCAAPRPRATAWPSPSCRGPHAARSPRSWGCRTSRPVTVTGEDVAAARPAVEVIARRTPVLTSRTFSERFGGAVSLKAENLQRTGSFKVRGAAAKLAALGDACGRGVVCASAGNHGQGVAAAAAALGIACEVYVPDDASIGKFEAMTSQGAKVSFGGPTVDDCLLLARTRADEAGMCFVH